MGVAMLSIMLFHQYFCSTWPLNLFQKVGFWGVEIFLFLSGMGLVRSLRKNTLKEFYRRRFLRIIPPCLVCGLAKYISYQILISFSPEVSEHIDIRLLSIMSLDLWFVYTIMILYISSPIIYNLLTKHITIYILAMLTVFFCSMIFVRPHIGDNWASPAGVMSWTIERLPVFSIGMIAGMMPNRLDTKTLRISYLSLMLAIFLTALLSHSILSEFLHSILEAIRVLALAIGTLALTHMILTAINLIHNNLIIPLNFIGKYSFEIYLVHEYIFAVLLSLVMSYTINLYLVFLIFFAISFIAAPLMRKICTSLFPGTQ